MNLDTYFDNPEREKEEENLYDWKRNVYTKDDVKALKNFFRNLKIDKGKKYDTWRTEHNRKFPSGFRTDRRQHVAVKMSYSKDIYAHTEYMKMYLPQLRKDEVIEKPEPFGIEIEEYKKQMVPLHFKYMLSPESQEIDLKAFAKCFINRLEALTGYDLYWLGCIHTNTDNNHVHLCINGKDRHGRRVFIPKDFVKKIQRDMACDIATKMIGERTIEQIKAEKKKLITAKRWTVYDQKILEYSKTLYAKWLNPVLVNRLSFLCSVNLARFENGIYVLNPDCEEVLKANSRNNLYLSEYLKPDSLPLHLFKGGTIRGKVDRVITFDKDESWSDAVILRTEKSRVFIPVYHLNRTDLEGKTVLIENAKGGNSRNVADRNIKIVTRHDLERSNL